MKENLLTEKEMVFLVLLYFHGERERELIRYKKVYPFLIFHIPTVVP